MSVHDCFCFCGFVLLVFGGIAGLAVLMQRDSDMKPADEYVAEFMDKLKNGEIKG